MHRIIKASIILALSLIFIDNTSIAQNKTEWNGYLQTRLNSNYLGRNSFSLRRVKFWLKGKTPFNQNISYKIQTIYRWNNTGYLALQDAYAEYSSSSFNIRAGQMKPDYSLEWNQADYKLPTIERAQAVNALVPGAKSMARDIGADVLYHTSTKNFITSIGIWNGAGANVKLNKKNNYLITNRSTFSDNINALHYEIGYSIAYRKSNQMIFSKIFGTNQIAFSGNDFRWGADVHLFTNDWEFQAEYLQANLGGAKAYGYYILSEYTIEQKNQVVFLLDKFHGLNSLTENNPWIGIGFNHLFEGNKLKMMFDTRAQFNQNKTNYTSTIQLQLFFN